MSAPDGQQGTMLPLQESPSGPQVSTLVPTVGGSFASGLGPRLALGVSFVLAASLLSYGIEHLPLATTVAAPTPIACSVHLQPTPSVLRLQSTFAVKQWAVSIDGRALDPSRSDPSSWQGGCPAGQSLLIEATPVDDADTQLHGLQLHLTTGEAMRDLAMWGNGAVIGTIAMRSP